MIHHISLAATNPSETAKVLAKFWNTQALAFPMYDNSFVVFCGEDSSSCIEIYPQGCKLHPSTPELPALSPVQTEPGGAFHAALSVPLLENEIAEICKAADWFCQTGPRGTFFSVVEVWVEGHTLLELLTPEMSAQYQSFANVANWKKTFGLDQTKR